MSVRNAILKVSIFVGLIMSSTIKAEDNPILPPPLPILPVDMTCITNHNPVFRWNNRYDVKSYILEIAKDKDFKENLIRIENIKPSTCEVIYEKQDYAITQTDYTLKNSDISGTATKGLSDGKWYWRIGYINNKDEKSLFSPWKTFEISSEDKDSIAIPSNVQHPYLYFTKADLPAIKAKLESSEEYKNFRKSLIIKADSFLKARNIVPEEGVKDLDYVSKGTNHQHGKFMSLARNMRNYLEVLGFAYQITGDKRYADKAKETMLALAKLDRWTGPWFITTKHFNPIWRSALETGEMCKAYATCYDWIYETLNEAERKTLRDALVQKGIEPLRDWFDPDIYCKIPRHQAPLGNWHMVCASGGGVAAMSVAGEVPEAKKWVREVRNLVRAWMNYRGGDYWIRDPYKKKKIKEVEGPAEPNFDEDGGYVESPGYFYYAVGQASYFMSTLKRLSGEDLFKMLPENTMDFFIYSFYETESNGKGSTCPDFGDCGDISFPELFATISGQKKSQKALWLFDKYGRKISNFHIFLEYDPSVKFSFPQIEWAKEFRGIGQVIMRSGWGPMQNMLAIKYHQNRGHCDIGTFSLFCLGKRFIIDSGTSGYASHHYAQYLSKTPAHNVVMVDNKVQKKTDGSILSFFKTPSLAYSCGELGKAYPEDLNSWKRHVIFVYPDYYVMLDELKGKSPHDYDWLIHNDGDITLEKDGFKIKNSYASIIVKMAGNDEFKSEKVKIDFPEESKNYNYSKIRPVEKKTNFDFFTIFYPYTDEKDTSNISKIDGTACKGFSVRRGKINDTILYSETGRINAGGISANGRIALCSTEDENKKLLQFMLCGGTSLTLDNENIISSDIPVNCAMTFTAEGGKGVVESSSPATVGIYSPTKVAACFVNGKKNVFESSGGAIVLKVPEGKNEIVLSNKNIAEAPEIKVSIPARKHSISNIKKNSEFPFAEPDPNIAQIYASSEKDMNLATQIIDGSTNPAGNCWVSELVDPPHWLIVEFKKPRSLEEIYIHHHVEEASRTVDFDLQLWDSKTNKWVTVDSVRGNKEKITVSKFPEMSTGKIRLLVLKGNNSNGNARIAEMSWK